MKDGFIKVAAATPGIHVADPMYNAGKIAELMEEARRLRVGLGRIIESEGKLGGGVRYRTR